MLLAIDVGNTHMVVGVFDGGNWRGTWRMHTNVARTEDETGAALRSFLERAGIAEAISRVIISNVVPALQETLTRLSNKWFNCQPIFVSDKLDLGLTVKYNPPSAVGADRLANAVAAIELYGTPIIVLDMGTATTLDAISRDKEYLGGAILPGVVLSMEALFTKAARLPRIALEPPENAIGRDTESSLRSGIIVGTAGAIDTLVKRFKEELGDDTRVIATGGLASTVVEACQTVELSNPNLTLEGLRIIASKNPLPK
jgi:type III pantothenate kinase